MIATWWSSKRVTSAGLVGALSGAMLLTGLPVAPVTPASASSVPNEVSFTTSPGDGSPGNTLTIQPKVHVTDSSHAAVDHAEVTLSLNVVFPANQPTEPAVLDCADANKVTTDSSGDATASGCDVSRSGRYTLTATVSGVTGVASTSETFDISGLSQLAFTTPPPTTITAGTTWGAKPVVTMRNTDGTTFDSTNHIGLLATTADNHYQQVSCALNPVVAVAGVASFSGCKFSVPGAYKVYAVDADSTPNLLGAPADVNVTAGTPTQVAFTTQPNGGPGGQAFTHQPVVAVQDADGHAVYGFTNNVTLSITSGTGETGAALTCAQNPLPAIDGVASFAGCKIDKAHTDYTLHASINSPSVSTDSSAFDISTDAASGISFSTPPSGAQGGAPFTGQPVVSLTDSGGNPVSGNVTLSIDPASNSELATLTCDALTVGTSAGAAHFSGCAIDKNGSYLLKATSGTHTATSNLLVAAGSASQLVFHAAPTAGSGGTAFAFGTQPAVDVLDSGGNPASADVTLSLAPGGTPGATLSCASTNTVAPDSSGRATFSGCKIDKAGEGYRLVATIAGPVTTTSAPFDVAVGSATQLAFTTQPGGGPGGEVWQHQPAVSLEDAGGNLVTSASAIVTLTPTSGQGASPLVCKDASVPTQNGIARFSGCLMDRAGTDFTLEAASDPSLDGATSAIFDITTGAPSSLVFSTQPGGAAAGSSFGTQPVVQVVDKGGNITDVGSTVGLSFTSGTGTAGAVFSCADRVANHGVASFSGCSINQAGAGYVLTATDSADHLTAESGNLSVLLPPPSPLGQAPTPLPLEQSFGGRIYGDNPTATTDKVNTATGALAFASTDVSVAGLGEPFVLERSYNSLDTTGGAFGRGWSSIFDISVKVVPGQTETVRGEDGQQLVWRFNPTTNSWVAPPGAHAQLTCGAKTCKLIRDDNVRWDVNLTANGRAQLADYQAPDGQGLKFAWTSQQVTVTLANNAGTITGTLDSLGRVIRIDTPTRHVSYTYSSAGLLTSVTDVLGHTWQYGYDGSGKLTSITDPTGATRLSAAYDGNSKVGSLQVSGDQQRSDTTFTYDTSPQATTRHVLSSVAGAAPSRQDYIDRYVGNVLVAQSMPSGATMQYSYDANLRLIESQDALGWTSTYTYDGFGNLTSQTVPVSSTRAATVRMQYDGQHRITSQTDATGNTTTYTYSGPWLSAIKPPATGNVQWTRFDYDGVGRLVDTVGPTNKRVFSYDASGNMTKVVIQDLAGKALNGAGTTFTYDEAGNRLSSTDPLGHKTTWTYDKAGHQTTSAPALGNATTNTFNAAGDPSSTTDAAGHTTEWSWNGSAGTRTTAVDHVTTLVQTYDPAGNLLRENPGAPTDPGTTYTYDASGRQLTKTDAAGITTHYSYDLNSNVVAADDTSGQVLTQSFNALGKLVRRTANGRVTSVTYDLAGNVTSSTDAAGNTTSFAYNPDSLVASAHNTAGTTSYSYDSAGNLVSVLDPVGHTTAYAYDALARRTKATEGGGSTTYAYDLDNSLISSTDPDGRKTAYTLDALHRVISTKYSQPGQQDILVGQTYDSLGRRHTMTDTSTHTYTYDSNGNLASANGFSYDWSQPGKIVETYPDTKTVTYSLDDQQKLMGVTSGTKGQDDYVSASYLRNAQRQTVGIAFANGVLETR
ncbi:MAG: sle, partial [Chthonomonadaceae bacterium]|nr:sle [Chthonomonadaceae bacterium]